ECDDLEEGHAVLDRLRSKVLEAELDTPGGEEGDRVTASIGVAATTQRGRPPLHDLLHEANGYLKRAKELGGNRVVSSLSRPQDNVA
ncbi:MAG: diguanylate cyclase domain-containing protein, partial [Planctomycetota bacterium]